MANEWNVSKHSKKGFEEEENAILVGIIQRNQTEEQVKEYLDELAFLALTAGAKTVKRFVQKLPQPHSRTFIGTGKLEEIQQYIEDRLTIEQLRNPSTYINGMEDLLFLSEIQKNFQIGLVSILPEFYAKKLNMISLPGIKYSMDYILKTQGARQKVAVVTDGARLLLR